VCVCECICVFMRVHICDFCVKIEHNF